MKPKTMISVRAAEALIGANVPAYSTVSHPLTDAHGHILREDIFADRDYPPYHRVTMDGIAISFDAWKKGRRDFKIETILQAGQPPIKLKSKNVCVQIMTGAVLPKGADCIIPIEDVAIDQNVARVRNDASVKRYRYIHKQGSDAKKGERLIQQGRHLSSTHIALIASTGKKNVLIAKAPSIALVSTGDEIVDLDDKIQSYQIRPSNVYGMHAALKQHGFDKVSMHKVVDDAQKTRALFARLLKKHDVLIISGGVSMGKKDLVPGALADLRARCVFHKIKQTPGKPFWFGLAPGRKPVFALPGNPASSLVCLHRYVIPALQKAMGLSKEPLAFATLTKDILYEKPMTFFMPVHIYQSDGGLQATPLKYGGSGDLVTLGTSDGFLELPAEKNRFLKGSKQRFFKWS